MEELAMTESQGPPMIFRPTIHLFSKKTINTNNPVIVINGTNYMFVLAIGIAGCITLYLN